MRKASRAVTMADVAARAKVSTTTVSHVLNGTRSVSESLARRVEEAITTLGYAPNVVARSLARSHTNLLGVVMSAISNPFFAPVFSSMDLYARSHGYSLVLTDSRDDPAEERRQVRLMLDQQVVGLVLAPSSPGGDPMFDELLGPRGVPTVLVDRVGDDRFDQATVEGVESTAALVTHLAEVGHSRIGFIAGDPGISTTGDRIRGYRKGLKLAHLSYDRSLVRTGYSNSDGGYRAAVKLLASPNPPTALVSANNNMTLGCMRAVRDSGRRIPYDLALCAYDDLEWADLINPALTVIRQPVERLGTTALELLVSRIAQPDSPRRSLVLPATFVHRSSCGCDATEP